MPPGFGFVLFIFPALVGTVVAAFLLYVPRLRFLAAYAALVPLFGALGLLGGIVGSMVVARPYYHRYAYGLSKTTWPIWVLTILGILFGLGLGILLGALAGRTLNRTARRLFPS
jgi:hypothetical protein